MSNKKIALITGSYRGIGKAIARELHSIGYTVIINGISNPMLPDSFIEEFGGSRNSIHYVQADVSLAGDRQKLLGTAQKLGRIDLLVNNAGVAPLERKDLLESSEESFSRLINVNLKGPFFLTQLIAKLMIELKNNHLEDYHPKIVNIGSISAYTSSVGRAGYCISKAGIGMMTRLYADRLAEYDIPVYEVRPGIIQTDMTRAVKKKYDILFSKGLTPIARWGTPEEVAKCVKAITLNYFPYSTGQIFNVDGGFHLQRL